MVPGARALSRSRGGNYKTSDPLRLRRERLEPARLVGRQGLHPGVLSPPRADSEPLDSRFNADMVVDGSADSLLATEITFSRLHRNVSEKELDLLQFSSSGMAQFRA